jgi:hypothetical protein
MQDTRLVSWRQQPHVTDASRQYRYCGNSQGSSAHLYGVQRPSST